MPVENIYNDGTIMYNVKVDPNDVSECYWSLFGDIHDDDDLPQDIVASAKAGKEKYWRYVTAAQAKALKERKVQLDALAAGSVFEPEALPEAVKA